MAIKDVLGFSLKPVKVDPDGFSAPPDPASLAPPSAAPDSVPAESALRASVPPEGEGDSSSDAPPGNSLMPDADEHDPDEAPATRPRRVGPGALMISIPPEPLIISAPPPPLFVSAPPPPPSPSLPPTGAEAADAVLASLAPPALSERPPAFDSLPPTASSQEPGSMASLPPEAPFVSIPPEPLIQSLPPPSSESLPPSTYSIPPALSVPPSLSVPPTQSLPPHPVLEPGDGSAFLSIPPGSAHEATVSLPPEGAYDPSLASIPPHSGGAGPSLPPDHDAGPVSSEGGGLWSSSEIDPGLAEAPPQDLFATRVEGLTAPEQSEESSGDTHGESPNASHAPEQHEPSHVDEQLLAAAGVRPRIDLKSGLLLGFAAFTSLMSAGCFVLLLLRSGPAPQPAAALGETPAAHAAEHAEPEAKSDKSEEEAKLGAKKGDEHGESTQHAPGDEHASEAAKAAPPAEHAAKEDSAHGEKAEGAHAKDEGAHAKAEGAHAKDEGAHAEKTAVAHGTEGAKDEHGHGAEHEPPRAATPAPSGDAHGEHATGASTAVVPPSAAASCRMVRPPRRLVRDVSPRIPIEASVTTGGDVLLGYVMADGRARAVKLEGSTQRVREQTSEPRMEEVTGVVPLGDTRGAEFAIDHPAADERSAWRTLPGPGAFALSRSRTNQVYLLGTSSKRPPLLWSLPQGASPTRPVIASAGSRRYAVAFRDGEPTSGQIRFGWVDVGGGPQGKLETLPLGAVEVGAPSLGARGDEILIAVALRDRAEAAWRVEVWRAGDKSPTRVVLPALQQGEVGDQIAPRLGALDGDRWALQWTTGKAGKRHVDLLVLDRALRGVGEPLMVSGVRASGGGGLLIPNGPMLLSLYLVQSSPEDYDLWLRVLDC